MVVNTKKVETPFVLSLRCIFILMLNSDSEMPHGRF